MSVARVKPDGLSELRDSGFVIEQSDIQLSAPAVCGGELRKMIDGLAQNFQHDVVFAPEIRVVVDAESVANLPKLQRLFRIASNRLVRIAERGFQFGGNGNRNVSVFDEELVGRFRREAVRLSKVVASALLVAELAGLLREKPMRTGRWA